MSGRLEQARALQGWMSGHRRHLHRHPEIGLDLPRTHDYLEGVLTGLGLGVERHDGAGLTVAIPGSAPDGVVSVLRADMDALPVEERSDVEFRSTIPDAMHACGHDLHMAMLLGAASVMTVHPPRRDAVLAFQPGEESDRGALGTLRHDNLQIDSPATAFAIHVHALEPVGAILHRPGPFMAIGDWFAVDVTGPGGHASQPHLAGNPIEAAADFTTGLRSLVAELGVDEHVVATVTECLMGNTVNVIPAKGRLRGTIRTLSPDHRAALIAGMRDLVTVVAERLGLDASLVLHEGYPAVINDADYIDRLTTRLSSTDLGAMLKPMTRPSMVTEDFSYFLQRWPGAMVYLGANVSGHSAFNHADDVVYHEDALAIGAALHLEAADGV
ncbi:M20 family metallopeptidase [Micromonospora sp. NPDC050200]|uniref:M20 metallopeptidase family protein n=1 Tax=Micromonospora sp. NPDC050200 TaxID=3155664 RepID=UPI0033F79D18